MCRAHLSRGGAVGRDRGVDGASLAVSAPFVGRGIALVVALMLLVLFSCGSKEVRGGSYTAVASWYGDEMKGRATASGTPFHKDSLTAAHRDFPFGTRLKVTNLSNDRSVVVVVNDRGPFVAGRDIDLSYAAAREIGLIGQGTGAVRIAHLGRDASYVREAKHASGKGPFTVQAGSFRDRRNAEHLKASLELAYHDVYVVEAEVGGEVYCRVRIGRFEKRGEVNGLARRLAAEGYDVLTVRYRDEGTESRNVDMNFQDNGPDVSPGIAPGPTSSSPLP